MNQGNLSRRAFIARSATTTAIVAAGATTAVTASAALVAPEVAAAVHPSRLESPTEVEGLYRLWMGTRTTINAGDPDDDDEPAFTEFERLQAAILAARPQTARDVALQYIADTIDFGAEYSDEWEALVRGLVATLPVLPSPDPLIIAIGELRAAEDAANRESNAVAFLAAVHRFESNPTVATSLAGVREALRHAIDLKDKGSFDCAECVTAIRGALAYFDGPDAMEGRAHG